MTAQVQEFKDWLVPENKLVLCTDPSHDLNHVIIHTSDGKPIMLNDTDALKLCQGILFAVKGHSA